MRAGRICFGFIPQTALSWTVLGLKVSGDSGLAKLQRANAVGSRLLQFPHQNVATHAGVSNVPLDNRLKIMRLRAAAAIFIDHMRAFEAIKRFSIIQILIFFSRSPTQNYNSPLKNNH